MRCAGYIRVSTLGQAETGESLHTQKDDIKNFAKFKKYDLVKIYEDAGISGHKAEKRPAFMQMLTDAKDKKFDYVVVSRMSRFARNTREMLNFVYDLDKYGVKFFSIKENMDSGDDYTGQLMFKILSAIAEWERESIRTQMSENKMRRWTNKKTFIGKPPYGYYWDKEKKQICVNEEEKNIYFRILDMYCNLGLSFKDIAIKLKEEGIVCKKKPFTSPTISYMLKNPAYYGNYVLNKHKHETAGGRKFKRDEDGNIVKDENGKSIKLMKPESEWIRFEIPAFISKQKWDQIQQKTQFNKIKGKRTMNSEDYWLRDILKCGECGGVVKPHHGSKRKDGTFPRYYSCYWAYCAPKVLSTCDRKKCCLPLIKAEELEKKIWSKVMMYLGLSQRNNLSKLIDPKKYDKKFNAVKNRLNKHENNRTKAINAKKRFYDLYADDQFDKNELSQRLNEKENEILEIDGLIGETKQEIIDMEESRENDLLWKNFIENEKDTLRQLRNDLYYLEPDDKKRVIESMVDEINIHGGIDNNMKVWLPLPFKLKFNESVLLDLIEKGKISGLNKNGSHHTSPVNI